MRRYRDKLSGPLLDRIDMHVAVQALRRDELQAPAGGDSSAVVRQRVIDCRAQQLRRQQKTNRYLSNPELEKVCVLNAEQQRLLERAIRELGLSARAYHRILKISRTIADLAGAEQLQTAHLAEAISYRALDRKDSSH